MTYCHKCWQLFRNSIVFKKNSDMSELWCITTTIQTGRNEKIVLLWGSIDVRRHEQDVDLDMLISNENVARHFAVWLTGNKQSIVEIYGIANKKCKSNCWDEVDFAQHNSCTWPFIAVYIERREFSFMRELGAMENKRGGNYHDAHPGKCAWNCVVNWKNR